MKAEYFEQASIKELQARADRCFALALNPLEEGHVMLTEQPLDDGAKLRLLLEAQFYLTAVGRKRDEEVANRDFRLEIWVIVLIGIEIILSGVGIWLGIREGNQQAQVLSNIEKSTSDSAGAMSAAKTSLEILAGSQTQSLGHLKQMDDSLQFSQKTTGAMASAARKQLQILQGEQASRASQLAKKPKLALYVGELPVNRLNAPFNPRSETITSKSFDFRLANEGDAIATRPLLRVIISNKDVSVQSTTQVQRPVEPADSSNHVFLLPLDNIRPKVSVPMTLTFTYPAGTKTFQVDFNVDADEIDAATFLGAIELGASHFPVP